MHADQPVEEFLPEHEAHFHGLMEQSRIAISIMTPDGRLISANPAFWRIREIEGNAVDVALEEYNLLEDEQARELALMPLIEEAFAGEAVVLPLYKYDAQQTASDIGAEAGAVHERWIKGRLYPVKDDAGQLKNVVLKEVMR